MNKDRTNLLSPVAAIIDDKVHETADAFSLRLSPQAEDFNFRAGQFNMTGLPGFGEAPFSFSLIDEAGRALVQTIRRAGNVVGALERLQKGQKLYFRGPYGNGWPLDMLKGRNVIIVAGGIGMAPLRPVVHHLLANRADFGQVYLLYGAKTDSDMLFKNDLAVWRDSINVLLAADSVSRRPALEVREGLVTCLFDRLRIPLSESVTFTCGPQIMMKFAAAGLIMDGQDPADIYVSLERRMKCGVGHCGHCQIGAKYVCGDGPVFRFSEIQKYADTLL